MACEEDEVLYSQSAQLFRFLGDKWKEQGVGDFKILRHKETNRTRLLMRRDHDLKICCNHYLTEELVFQRNDDKSFIWSAPNSLEGVILQETLAIRFKTAELAQTFKTAIVEARNPSQKEVALEIPSEGESGIKPASTASSFSFKLGEESPSKGSSFSFGDRFGNVSGFTERTVASPVFGGTKDTSNLNKEDTSDVEILFTKHATPEQQEQAKRLLLPAHFYLHLAAPPSPVYLVCDDESHEGATHVPAENSSTLSTDAAAESFKFSGAGATVFGAKNDSDRKDASDYEEDDSHDDSLDPHFEPIVQLPSIVEVKTGEEDEEKLYSQMCKLYRFDSNVKQWKELGCGEMKVLKHMKTGRCRLLMRREQDFKLFCNHYITKEMQFNPKATCESAWLWTAMDFSDEQEQGLLEKFTVRFKNVELAKGFKAVIEDCQRKME